MHSLLKIMSNSKVTTLNETRKQKPVIKLSKAQSAKPGESELLSNLGLIRDILIYESSNVNDPILGGQYKQLKLKNYYNRVTNSSRTIANAVALSGANLVKNSDCVTKAIGQKSYDLVFHALCSVLSNEAKIKAMLALLTIPNKHKDCSTQTDNELGRRCDTNDTASQTDIMTPLNLLKKKKQFRNKKKLVPYVVRNDDVGESQNEPIVFVPNESSVQKIVISPENFKKFMSNDLPILENVHKDLDQESDTNLSELSLGTVGSVFDHGVESLLNFTNQRIEKNIKSLTNESDKSPEASEIFDSEYKLCDGSIVTLPTKPKTVFHIATHDNLALLTPEDKRKVILHQAFVDWKLCLQPNEDGNLPIHLAVVDNDVDFLVRQCVVLRSRKSHVDVFPQKRNLSALHIAIMREASVEIVEKLLEFQADPLEALEDHKTAFHRAAEASNPAYMERLLQHVAKFPRELLQSNKSLFTEDIKSVTKEQYEELTRHLYQCISEMCDDDGYTPLMLASKAARYQNVRLLLEKCSSTVNVGMKTSGNTALYLAVQGAGMDASERGDKSKISEDYLNTIECLLSHHADPAIENFSGGNVTMLLAEFNMNSLSMFVAHKMSALRDIPQTKKIDEFMVIREGSAFALSVPSVTYNSKRTKEVVEAKNVKSEPGRIGESNEINSPKSMEANESKVDLKKVKTEHSKPVILENRRIIPEKTTVKGMPISFVGRSASMINLSLNSHLTVPKKSSVKTKTVKDARFNRDIAKRKFLGITDLEAKKAKLKIIKKIP